MNLYVPCTFGECAEHVLDHLHECHPDVHAAEFIGEPDERHYIVISTVHIQLHKLKTQEAVKRYLANLGMVVEEA